MDAEDALMIGARARLIRRRRGMGLATAAGLAGISKGYLSMLERGQRRFERRGLLEDLAGALGCAVADLTGQPYLPPDRQGGEVAAALAEVSVTLHDATLRDVPDLPARLLPHLIAAAVAAHARRWRMPATGQPVTGWRRCSLSCTFTRSPGASRIGRQRWSG